MIPICQSPNRRDRAPILQNISSRGCTSYSFSRFVANHLSGGSSPHVPICQSPDCHRSSNLPISKPIVRILQCRHLIGRVLQQHLLGIYAIENLYLCHIHPLPTSLSLDLLVRVMIFSRLQGLHESPCIVSPLFTCYNCFCHSQLSARRTNIIYMCAPANPLHKHTENSCAPHVGAYTLCVRGTHIVYAARHGLLCVVCVCICICIYIYIYTHTPIFTSSNALLDACPEKT